MQDEYWFVKAYLGLLIMAPMMNAFIENASQKQVFMVLLWFYVLQTILGWITYSASFLMGGYSTMSFMGLYMLARYVRLYSPKLTGLSCIQCFGGYFALTIFMAVIGIFLLYFGGNDYYMGKLVVSYTNPFTVMASLFLLLGFAKLKIHSRLINWIAASCFAVFLLHENSYASGLFTEYVLEVYHRYDSVACIIMMFLALLLVFCLAIIVDQVRILCWRGIEGVWSKVGRSILINRY